jgi:murein DD-endopeptidase MepM/ murein hydrolase activator NlpD
MERPALASTRPPIRLCRLSRALLAVVFVAAGGAAPALASNPHDALNRALDQRRVLMARERTLERRIVEDHRRLLSLKVRLVRMRTAQDAAQTRSIFELDRRSLRLGNRLSGELRGLGQVRSDVSRAGPRIKALRELIVRLSRLLQYCPVDEPHWYHDDFGVISMREGRHVHQGIDIHAAWGTPIRAPFPGQAVVATNPIGGLAVKVFGTQGFAYNAHLAGFGHLGSVSAGTVIGFVGNTGDAKFTQPHDHFEWHPSNGPAVDPFVYLNEAC